MISDKRPDETDDYRTLNTSQRENDQTAMKDINSKAVLMNHLSLPQDHADNNNNKNSLKNRLYDVFLNFVCGIEPDELNELSVEAQQHIESVRRVENFYSMHQTKAEKLILNLNLIMIVLISLGLYIFFSIPPEYHIFSDLVKPNTLN
jgi:hypothetical protein